MKRFVLSLSLCFSFFAAAEPPVRTPTSRTLSPLDAQATQGLKNLQGSAGYLTPVSIVVIGDSFNIGYFAGLERFHIRGAFRCLQAAGGGDSGVTIHDGDDDPGHGPLDYTLSPDGMYYEIADGGNLTCGHLQYGTGGPADQVHYTLFPGTGTAQLEYSYSGATWTPVGSPINTASITSVQCGTVALPFGYTNSVRCRVTATGGTVNGWIGQGMEGPGLMFASFATSGQSMAQTMSIGETRWKAMLTAWGTDLVISSWYDGRLIDAAGIGTGDDVGEDNWTDNGPFDRAYDWSKAAVPTVDWLFVSPHQVNPDNDYARTPAPEMATLDAAYTAVGIGINAEERNRYSQPFIRAFALDRGEAYVDCYHMFPSFAAAAAQGMYANDPTPNLHLSDAGKSYKANLVFRESGLEAVFVTKAAAGLSVNGYNFVPTQNFGQGNGLALYNYLGVNQQFFTGSVCIMGATRPDGAGARLDYLDANGSLRITTFNGGSSFPHVDFNSYGMHPATTNQGALGKGSQRFEGAFVGGLSAGIATKTTTYTATATDHTLLGDATGGAFTITLPVAAPVLPLTAATSQHNGRIYAVKKIDSTGNAVTIAGSSYTRTSGVTNGTTSITFANGGQIVPSVGSLITGTNIPAGTYVTAATTTTATLSQAASGSGSGITFTFTELIDGATTVTLSSQWDRVQIQSNGAVWFVIAN